MYQLTVIKLEASAYALIVTSEIENNETFCGLNEEIESGVLLNEQLTKLIS